GVPPAVPEVTPQPSAGHPEGHGHATAGHAGGADRPAAAVRHVGVPSRAGPGHRLLGAGRPAGGRPALSSPVARDPVTVMARDCPRRFATLLTPTTTSQTVDSAGVARWVGEHALESDRWGSVWSSPATTWRSSCLPAWTRYW